jgi:hypothetical protein
LLLHLSNLAHGFAQQVLLKLNILSLVVAVVVHFMVVVVGQVAIAQELHFL